MPESIEGKKKKKKWLKYLLCGLLLIALIALTATYLFKDASPKEVFSVMRGADPVLLLIAVALTLGYVLFEALGLFAVIRSHGDKTNFLANVKYAATDFYFCGITPSASGGQPVVAVFMAKDGLTVAFSTIVLLLSTATFKIVLVLLSIVALFFVAPIMFSSGNILLAVLFIVGMLINVAFIVFCLFLVYKPSIVTSFGKKTLKLLCKIKIVKNFDKANAKLDSMLDNYREGANYAKTHLRVIIRMLIYTVVQRIMLFSVGYLVALSLGAAGTDYFLFTSMQIVIATAVDSMPFPGGVGLSETLLKRLYLTVYSAELMMPALLLTRGISFYLLLLATGLFVLICVIARMIKTAVKNKRKESNL